MNVGSIWESWSQDLAMALVHFLWQGAGIGLLAFILLWLLRNRPQRQYNVACLAFFALPLCLVTTCLIVHENKIATRSSTLGADVADMVVPSGSDDRQAAAANQTAGTNSIALIDVPQPTSGSGEVEERKGRTVISLWSASSHPWIIATVLTYLAGVMAMLAKLLVGLYRCRILMDDDTSLDRTELVRLMHEQCRRLGLRRVPGLLVSRRIHVPIVLGFLSPLVVWPAAFVSGWDPQHMGAILAHELAHIRRYDPIVNLLQRLVEAVLFFHPVTWWLSRRIHIAREICCDETAAGGIGTTNYALALLTMAERCAGLRGVELQSNWMALSAGGGHSQLLGYRIRRLIGDHNSAVGMLTPRSAILLFVMLFVGAMSAYAWSPRSSVTASDSQLASSDDVTSETADPIPENPAGVFDGIVRGPDGQPLSGARIYVVRSNANAIKNERVRATTDAQGHFRFFAPDMMFRLEEGKWLRREALVYALADGLAPDWKVTWGDNTSTFREYWTPREGTPIELHLTRITVPIRGKLLDPTGRPLTDASVRAAAVMVPRNEDLTVHLDHWSKANMSARFLTKAPDYKRELMNPTEFNGAALSTQTDDEGRFELAGFGDDRIVRLEILSPSTQSKIAEVMTRVAPDVGTFLDFDNKPTDMVYGANFQLTLEPGLTVTGIVRDRNTKEPVPDMWVTKYYHPLLSPHERSAMAVTDREGKFTIHGLHPKTLEFEESHRYIAAIAKPGNPYQMFSAVIQNDGTATIEVARGIPYRLRLTDDAGSEINDNATVEYHPIIPNPKSASFVQVPGFSNWPKSNTAVRQADGSFIGFALPGPGVIVVTLKDDWRFQKAPVDPRPFFEPDSSKWYADGSQYGNDRFIMTFSGAVEPKRYSAVKLLNVSEDSKSLELDHRLKRNSASN
ncbi:MAG: M56 family metallopeptidase [Pirellulales bacterium]